MKNLKYKILWSIIILLSINSIAQDGLLDSTFGNGGIVLTEIGFGGGAEALKIQDNGKILVGGYAAFNMRTYFVLIRFNEDGSYDDSFGSNGVVTTQMGINGFRIKSIEVQEDDKILVAGSYHDINPQFDIALVRYNSDGSLDNSFGNGGKVIIDIMNNIDSGDDLSIQEDGKIIVVGSAVTANGQKMIALRYMTDGSLDATFGNDGVVIVPYPEGRIQVANNVATLPKGKILISGTLWPVSPYTFFTAVRLLANGDLDSSFANYGILSTSVGEYGNLCTSMALYPNGKFILTGFSYPFPSGHSSYSIARYNENGSLDSSFNSTGMKIIDLGGTLEESNGCKIQSDGKILLTGQSRQNQTLFNDFTIVRLEADGSFDNSFNSSGVVFTDVYGLENRAFAIDLQNDGKIVIAGITYSISSPDTVAKITTLRYTGSAGPVNVDSINNNIVNTFYLEQNYPNPFNPSTKISWQVTVGSHQTLKIYDVLGNEVATLVDEYKSAGSYEVEWNASSYPSGIYFYQLKNETFFETKKMILIK